MTPSKILFYLCLSFVAGIFFESLIKIPQIFLWTFLFFAIFMIFICFLLYLRSYGQGKSFKLGPYLSIAGFCILFLVLGILRMQISEFNIANNKLSKSNDRGQIILIGIISGEPDIRDTFQKLKVDIEGSAVLVATNRYPEYKYLDKIKLTGKLETPSVTDEFNYKNYLMKDGIYSVMNFPKVELISSKHKYNTWSFLYEKILFFKQKLRESIKNNFSPPQSSILEGTILGDNGAMTQELKNKLNITGLRHIVAVSGTHIVILSAIIMSLLMFLGFYRGQAFYIVIILIFSYIVLTGFPASGIRAGIMGGIFLLAQKLGRQSATLRIIALAGAVMLLLNPLLLFYDVGFQLSFLAVLGLIYLDPPAKIFLQKFFRAIERILVSHNSHDRENYGTIENKTGNLFNVVSATLSAQIFTLPILVYNFGNISYVSLVTNILISPIVSLLMVFGFLLSIAGVFSNIFGQIFFMPCYFLLLYFVWVIDFFSQPWAMKVVQNVSWIWLVISYLIIGLFTKLINKRYKQNFV